MMAPALGQPPATVGEAYQQATYRLDEGQRVPIHSTFTAGPTFGERLADALRPVVEPQHVAETAVAEFARGEEGEIHRTMLALSRADISLRLFVTTRNKCLEAFREVLHMGG